MSKQRYKQEVCRMTSTTLSTPEDAHQALRHGARLLALGRVNGQLKAARKRILLYSCYVRTAKAVGEREREREKIVL